MINNRIRNYDYINKQLLESPPIIKHKDNISEQTMFNTIWTQGYHEGYIDGATNIPTHFRYTIIFFLVLGFSIGLSIGVWL